MLIERKNETEILKNALAAPGSRFVAVYGRRRIGKIRKSLFFKRKERTKFDL